ncbi:hypothetical protein [Saliphagus infecundisoli]|uniref:DUF4382 domain-containing protein n=1 Tax=Saliphagus infecundisoli TaxID=1849069 RepID=A0ABD5QIR8_9EURY|nr:hypothetical protein [Saliphagus infecundisoli]
MYRRRLLTASGASLAGLGVTGCLGSGSEESVFEEITGTGWNLVVTFAEESQIEEISLVTPDGDVFTGGSLELGQRRVALPLVEHNFGEIQSSYRPGDEYTLAVVDADDERHERAITLDPAVELSKIAIFGETEMGQDPSTGPFTDLHGVSTTAPAITLENEGNAPGLLFESGVIGENVPNPRRGPENRDDSTPDGARLIPLNDDRYGMQSTIDGVVVGADETTHAVTAYHPFAFPEEDFTEDDLATEWAGTEIEATLVVATFPETEHRATLTVAFDGEISRESNVRYFEETRLVEAEIE